MVVAAGALTGTGQLNWFGAISAAVFGSIVAGVIWFYLGRYGGQRVLHFLSIATTTSLVQPVTS